MWRLLIFSMERESRALRVAESKLRDEKERALRSLFLGSLLGDFRCLKS